MGPDVVPEHDLPVAAVPRAVDRAETEKPDEKCDGLRDKRGRGLEGQDRLHHRGDEHRVRRVLQDPGREGDETAAGVRDYRVAPEVE